MFNITKSITDGGAQLLAAWLAGGSMQITRAAAGSGYTDPEALPGMTQLADEKQALSLIGKQQSEKVMTVKLQAPANTTAYVAKEVGVWASLNGGAETLIAVYEDEVGVNIPAAATSPEFLWNFFARIVVNHSGEFTLVVDTSAAVSMSTLEEALAEKQDVITATGILKRDANGNIVTATEGVDFDSSGTMQGSSASTAAAEVKVVNVGGVTALQNGDLLVVHFTAGNTALSPKLNVDGLGAVEIRSKNSTGFLPLDNWEASDYCFFMFDGSYWVYLMRFVRFATLANDGKVLKSQLRDTSDDISYTVEGVTQTVTQALGTCNEKLEKAENLYGSTDPTSATKDAIGQTYFNTVSGVTWTCSAINGNVYTWVSKSMQGFVASAAAPVDTTKLWIDTTPVTGGLKYHNGTSWVHVPVAYT